MWSKTLHCPTRYFFPCSPATIFPFTGTLKFHKSLLGVPTEVPLSVGLFYNGKGLLSSFKTVLSPNRCCKMLWIDIKVFLDMIATSDIVILLFYMLHSFTWQIWHLEERSQSFQAWKTTHKLMFSYCLLSKTTFLVLKVSVALFLGLRQDFT